MNVKIIQSEGEKEQAFQVRTTVFVDEQKVPPEEEIDAYDDTAIHFVGYENDQPIAASRLRFADDYGKLERICVLKEHRGKAYGSGLIREMERVIADKGYKKSKLNAQIQAEKFYAQLGYETVSGEFLDAGIPHVTMTKLL